MSWGQTIRENTEIYWFKMASSLEDYRRRASFSVPRMQDVLIGREILDFKRKV